MKRAIIVSVLTIIPFVASTNHVGHRSDYCLLLPEEEVLIDKNESAPTLLPVRHSKGNLYLSEAASVYINDIRGFEEKIRQIAKKMDISPDWLMALIHSESHFNALQKNQRGSGAYGLLQLKPVAYASMGIKQVSQSPLKQLEYAGQYLQIQKKVHGKFRNFTELKLAVLYPSALKKPNWHVLFKYPSKRYKQNKGLDVNNDGKITVSDVHNKMRKQYTKLYH